MVDNDGIVESQDAGLRIITCPDYPACYAPTYNPVFERFFCTNHQQCGCATYVYNHKKPSVNGYGNSNNPGDRNGIKPSCISNSFE